MANLMNNIDVHGIHRDGCHPVVSYAFDDLLKKLNDDIELGRINSRTSGNLVLFDYNSYGIFDHGWSEVALLSRGLVLDIVKKKVVAYCFLKFFNFGEVSTKLPNTKFSAYKKYDGSLGICYWDEYLNKWKVNTRGSFESDQSVWATHWINEDPNRTKSLVKGCTYLFEIIYPLNKIVIAYSFSGLVLLGGYGEDGKEFTRVDLELISLDNGYRLAEEDNFNTVEELIEKSNLLSVNEEGWVLHYPCGYRVKIKGSEYCRVHRLLSNCTPLSVWDSFISCDDFDILKKDLPEEFHVDIDNMISIFSTKLDEKIEDIRYWVNFTKKWDNKKIGLSVLEGVIPKDISKWIFACRKCDFFAEVNKAGDIRKKICEGFRPKANMLEGYEPTSAMNRFAGELE